MYCPKCPSRTSMVLKNYEYHGKTSNDIFESSLDTCTYEYVCPLCRIAVKFSQPVYVVQEYPL